MAEPRVSDSVDCTVFAPPIVAPGSLVLVQVFLHTPGQERAAAALATEFDPTGARRGFRGLELPIPHGTRVDLELTVLGARVDVPVQRLVWQGRPEAAQFDVHVPVSDCPPFLAGIVTVRRQGVPIGRVGFRLAVSIGVSTSESTAHTENQRRFERAFASYATPDRSEVLKRVQVLRAAGIECFQDVLDLGPGERWERELYRRIDRSDLFLLFWSRAAKRSEWVRREVQYALARQRGDPDAEPDIRPVLIARNGFRPFSRRRVEVPWAEVAHLHFDDLLVHVVP